MRLLIPPPESDAAISSVTEHYDHMSTSPSRSKRSRSSEDLVDESLAAAARPSLDFEKMREVMRQFPRLWPDCLDAIGGRIREDAWFSGGAMRTERVCAGFRLSTAIHQWVGACESIGERHHNARL